MYHTSNVVYFNNRVWVCCLVYMYRLHSLKTMVEESVDNERGNLLFSI